MKVRQHQETKGRGCRRSKKKVSPIEKSMPAIKPDVIVLDTSSSEDPTPTMVFLLNSTNESTNGAVNNRGACSQMKEVRIVLSDLANVPGALSSKQLNYLAERRLRTKKEASLERRQLQRQLKKTKINIKMITKAISISSDSIEGGTLNLDEKAKPTRLDKKSQKSNEKRSIKAEKNVVESTTPLAFGEKTSLEASTCRIDKKNDLNEKAISICVSSKESALHVTTPMSTTTTKKAAKKRKRCKSESEIHSFTMDLEESSRWMRNRKLTKWKKKQPRHRQGEDCVIVNRKSELSVDQVDSTKASTNNDARGDKLTDAVKDTAGTVSIAPVDESIAIEKTKCKPVNENIAPATANIVPINESIKSGRASIIPEIEGIAADRSIVYNESAATRVDKVSMVNDVEKTSTSNNNGKTFDHSLMVNSDLKNEDFSSLQPFLDCNTDIKMIRLQTNENEHLTLFSASHNNAYHGLDKETCSFASIVEAIDNDLAGGNQPIGLPFGVSIDNTEMMSLLPDSSMSNNEVNQSDDVERRQATSKNHESLVYSPVNGELAPILGNGNYSFEIKTNRKLPAIVDERIVPEGMGLSFETIRANRKRKKFRRANVSTPSSSVDDNRNFADSIEITLTHEKLSDSIIEWEIDDLPNKKRGNNEGRAFAKDGQICEDTMNNNRETTIMNKNEIHSEKQRDIINDDSAKPLTSQIEEGSCKEYNALKCLLDMGPDVLEKAIADGEVGSDLGSFDGPQIDEALAQFENSMSVNNSKSNSLNDPLNGEARTVSMLTVQNLKKFNSRVGLVETESKTTSLQRCNTIDTDASQQTDNTNDSARMRKRKWISSNGDEPVSSPLKRCTIKLNRKMQSRDHRKPREKCRDIETPSNHCLDPEGPVAEVAKFEDKKNVTVSPLRTEAFSMMTQITKKLISPIKNVQECANEIGAFVPDFGGSSLGNLATSTPTKNAASPVTVSGNDESLGSSNSSSSADSSSGSSSSSPSFTSSDTDSSDEFDDEDISNNVKNVEKPEGVSTRNSETPWESDIGTKNSLETTRHTVNENSITLFGSESERTATEKSAGSLDDNRDDPENSDDDKSDCISLYTESLCMSRHGTPERQVSLRCSALAVSSPKLQKRGNVRTRLGPRVQTQPNAMTAATKGSNSTEPGAPTAARVDCEPAANDKDVVEPSLGKVRDRLVPPNVIGASAGATSSLDPDPTATSRTVQRQIKILFRGHCFSWLKTGLCRIPQCRFHHIVHPQLQHQLFSSKNTRPIILHAISHRYVYFINMVFKRLMSTMTVRQIIKFGIDLCTSGFFIMDYFIIMIESLRMRRLTLVEVVELFNSMMSQSDVDSAAWIIESFYTLLEPGSYWKTLKSLMIKFAGMKLPITVVTAVLDECVKLYRNKLHVDDVHDNLVIKLTNDAKLAIGGDLLKTFYDLRHATVDDETNGLPVESAKKSNLTCSIASPDSVRESIDFPLAAQLADRPLSLSSTPVVQPQIVRETSKPSSVSQSKEAPTSDCESYTLKHLDKLPPPKSAYNLWKFHLDLQGVQQGLLHNDYDHVIKVLTALQEDPNRLPHIAGFYNILCKEIMSSRHHLEEIVRRTVHSGATDELRRFVYDLGLYVLTTLADTGAWVLAYQLLKTFKVYGQYNNCAFTLLSAEIYIANHRPLKALAILKQSRLVFSNKKMWNQMWCLNDEPLRVVVIELLLGCLCDGYAEHALSLLDFILVDQCSSTKPINISRYIDRVAAVLLKEDLPNAVVDLGRLIVENNLLVNSRTFRALINRIIHGDPFLARQLHRYATWLGIYNMPKISGVTHMIVNINWTEEEMYLMFSSLLHDLYINIGHAIDRLRPRQLAVYLILEQLPTEHQLLRDISGPPLTNADIRKRIAVVRSVFERFDPKIKIIKRLQGKLCKIQSESLVNYLKAGHFKC